MTFRVGQQIVCVDNQGTHCLKTDRVYVCLSTEDIFLMVDCCATHRGENRAGWFKSRFRPLVERKTDISVFTKMLTGERTDA